MNAPSMRELLKRVSRSFYLSLAVLPARVSGTLSLAYLLARAADTIADTRAVAVDARLDLLEDFRGALEREPEVEPFVTRLSTNLVAAEDLSVSEAEVMLLRTLGDCLRAYFRFEVGDRVRTRWVLLQLIEGMERDLRRFGDGRTLTALRTLDELDEHTYFAAGCVGEYWTQTMAAHIVGLGHLHRHDWLVRGIRLGKALQLVNVMRDAPADLAMGRCYFPLELLSQFELTPELLRAPSVVSRVAELYQRLDEMALAHVKAAWPYVLAIPRRWPQLRLAALWPLWIGVDTLALLRREPTLLARSTKVKISRQSVYQIAVTSTALVGSNTLLDFAMQQKMTTVGQNADGSRV